MLEPLYITAAEQWELDHGLTSATMLVEKYRGLSREEANRAVPGFIFQVAQPPIRTTTEEALDDLRRPAP